MLSGNYIPPAVTLRNSAFWHTVFLYASYDPAIYIYIAIISLNTINGFIFIMELDCVLCEVRLDFLCLIYMNFSFCKFSNVLFLPYLNIEIIY